MLSIHQVNEVVVLDDAVSVVCRGGSGDGEHNHAETSRKSHKQTNTQDAREAK